MHAERVITGRSACVRIIGEMKLPVTEAVNDAGGNADGAAVRLHSRKIRAAKIAFDQPNGPVSPLVPIEAAARFPRLYIICNRLLPSSGKRWVRDALPSQAEEHMSEDGDLAMA